MKRRVAFALFATSLIASFTGCSGSLRIPVAGEAQAAGASEGFWKLSQPDGSVQVPSFSIHTGEMFHYYRYPEGDAQLAKIADLARQKDGTFEIRFLHPEMGADLGSRATIKMLDRDHLRLVIDGPGPDTGFGQQFRAFPSRQIDYARSSTAEILRELPKAPISTYSTYGFAHIYCDRINQLPASQSATTRAILLDARQRLKDFYGLTPETLLAKRKANHDNRDLCEVTQDAIEGGPLYAAGVRIGWVAPLALTVAAGSDLTPFGTLTPASLSLDLSSPLELSPIHSIRALTVTNFGENDLSRLAELTQLESLTITDENPVTDLSPLEFFPNLRRLVLPHVVASASATGYRPITLLKDLESLDVNGDMTNDDVRALSSLTALKALAVGLPGTCDLDAINKLPSLQSLRVSARRLGSLETLAQMKPLRDLIVEGSQVDQIAPISVALDALPDLRVEMLRISLDAEQQALLQRLESSYPGRVRE